MIDIQKLRDDPDAVIQNLAKRGVPAEAVRKLATLDKQWRELTAQFDKKKAEQNAVSKRKPSQAEIEQMREMSQALKGLEKQVAVAAAERVAAWQALPNVVAGDVPKGGADDYEVVQEAAEIPKKDFPQKGYLELLEPHMIDVERAAKVSGSRFVYLKGQLARLQIGLISYAFDKLTASGFTPVIPPVLIGKEAMSGMGYLGQHADEVYKTQDNLYLTGTSEQAIGPMHMDEQLSLEELPKRYVGYSTCFRREAGSHGKDVRGILRMHQFDKVEMFSFASPRDNASEQEHEFLLEQQKQIMRDLGLPYRVIKLAAQDLGMPSAKTYDIETWIPSEGRFRETHSASNTTDYQARRLNIRLKEGRSSEKVHLLNGTALAIGRILIAIIENYQQADGSISIPEILKPYVPFDAISLAKTG